MWSGHSRLRRACRFVDGWGGKLRDGGQITSTRGLGRRGSCCGTSWPLSRSSSSTASCLSMAIGSSFYYPVFLQFCDATTRGPPDARFLGRFTIDQINHERSSGDGIRMLYIVQYYGSSRLSAVLTGWCRRRLLGYALRKSMSVPSIANYRKIDYPPPSGCKSESVVCLPTQRRRRRGLLGRRGTGGDERRASTALVR